MTLDEHISAARNKADGKAKLVAALAADPTFQQEARQRLADIAALEQAGRLEACWISRLTKETLTAALAEITP